MAIRGTVPLRTGVRCVVAALGIWMAVRGAHAQSCELDECVGEGSASHCAGDCDNNGSVTIDEILTGVNIALGNAPIGDCLAFDLDASSTITVDELLTGINAALAGCPAPPPTATATTEPTPATTPTASINPQSPTPTLSASASPGVSPHPSTPSAHVTLALQVGPAGALVFEGSSRWLRVDLTRGAGFTGDVDVIISDPPAGVSGDFVTLPSDVATQGLAISVAAGTPLGELSLTFVASGGGANASAQVVVNVLAAAPSSQEKIAAALAAGEIDLATSLLYRCYARAGDALLPEALRGSGSEEDLGLPQAIEAASSALSAQQLAALRPYTVRPDHPESVYAWVPGRRAQRARASAPEDCSGGNQWRSKRSASIPVRVWIECDEVGDSTLDRILATFEKLWDPMIVLMNPPLRDLGGDDEGGDDAIDVYLVLGSIRRGGELHDPYSLAALDSVAYATPAPPFRTNAAGRNISSGFIVAPRNGANSQSKRLDLTHEFFHILQFGHNVELTGREAHWFVEASATWAEVHFDRVIPWPARVAGEIHRNYFSYFQSDQREAIALNASQPRLHPYASYIWPFFLEQLYATDDIIGDIWFCLDRVANWDEADDVMEFHGNFTGNFHTFAIRNLNAEFLPGDPLPASERYAALDELFPDKLYPPKKESVRLSSGTVYTKALDMPPLSAAYFEVNPVGSSHIRKVELDFTGLPQRNLDVDALVLTFTDDDPLGLDWLPKPLSFSGQGTVLFCFDEGPTTATRRGAFDKLVLVLSNHALREPIEGELRITPSSTPCGVWAGTTTQTINYDDGLQRITGTITTNVAFEFDEEAAKHSQPGQTPFRLQGGDFVYEWTFDYRSCHSVATAGGAMHRANSPRDISPGATGAILDVYSGNPPTYDGSGASYADITTVTICPDDYGKTSTDIGLVAWWVGVAVQPVQPDGKTIRGSNDVSGGIHSEWTFTKIRK